MTKNEHFNADFEGRPRPKNKAKLQDRWRKTTKNELLNLKISGKEDKKAKEILHKRRTLLRNWLLRVNSEDVFEDFMSSVAEAFDPHSNYFSAVNAANFNIDISKSLEGIGARLTQDVDYTTINELIPGGPAFKSEQLAPADRIVGVAQGDTAQFVDVIGWRINEVVQLIRGKKGTVVRLLVLPAKAPPNGTQKEVRLVRDKIKLEDAIATSKIYDIDRGGKPCKLGVITLPSFYVDWAAAQRGEKAYRSASQDVRRILKELKTAKVEGVLMDLRKNGGGALSEAISLTGLFIESGPVVQVQDSEKQITGRKDIDPSISYAGPLLVLVDRFSASASEIFAGCYTGL